MGNCDERRNHKESPQSKLAFKDIQEFIRGNESVAWRVWDHVMRIARFVVSRHNFGGDNANTFEDIAQISLEKILRCRLHMRDESHASSWVFRVVLNTAIDSARKSRRQGVMYDALPQDSSAHRPTPEEELEYQEFEHKVSTCIEELPANHRVVLKTSMDEPELSYHELGLKLGMKTDAARMALYRARTQLRKALSKRGQLSTHREKVVRHD